jgi:hypothetical protein
MDRDAFVGELTGILQETAPPVVPIIRVALAWPVYARAWFV